MILNCVRHEFYRKPYRFQTKFTRQTLEPDGKNSSIIKSSLGPSPFGGLPDARLGATVEPRGSTSNAMISLSLSRSLSGLFYIASRTQPRGCQVTRNTLSCLWCQTNLWGTEVKGEFWLVTARGATVGRQTGRYADVAPAVQCFWLLG